MNDKINKIGERLDYMGNVLEDRFDELKEGIELLNKKISDMKSSYEALDRVLQSWRSK